MALISVTFLWRFVFSGCVFFLFCRGFCHRTDSDLFRFCLAKRPLVGMKFEHTLLMVHYSGLQ